MTPQQFLEAMAELNKKIDRLQNDKKDKPESAEEKIARLEKSIEEMNAKQSEEAKKAAEIKQQQDYDNLLAAIKGTNQKKDEEIKAKTAENEDQKRQLELFEKIAAQFDGQLKKEEKKDELAKDEEIISDLFKKL